MHTILTYHSISSPPEPLPADADLSPEKFEAHLRWLAAHRRVVPLVDVLTAPARSRLVAVTFDDGFGDNLTAALPLLEKYRTPATIFVTAGFVGREGYLTEDDVRELAAHPLITVGAHGLHHRHFARLTADEARHELRESRRMLEAITGRTVDLMAWPYGECNRELERMSAESGYRAAWSVWHGRNTSHSLWRVPLSRYDTLPRFVLKVSRAYFPVKRLLRPPLSAESVPQAEGARGSRMKILFYNHTGQVSGAERLLTTILARLDRRRFAAEVICPDNGPLAGVVASLGVPCEAIGRMEARFTWRMDRLLGSLANCYGIARELRRRVVASAPDVVHANSIRAGLVATLATAGMSVPVVWHLHDLLPAHALSTGVRAAAALSPRTRLLAISEAVARNFRGVLVGKIKNRPPITTILNAIDIERFRASEAQSRAVREELGLTEARPVLGIVGHLAPSKGQLELLRAFAAVVKEVPDAVLLVVGAALFERDYARRLTETARDLGLDGNVRFVGPREDVAAVMRALDVLVVNSWAEPFGLVVLEAMAAGTPVLATAAGGVPEIIRHGETGYLVPPGDQQALAAAILTLTRHPTLRRRLAAQACAEVGARFCFERYMRELEAYYVGCAPS